MGCGAVVSEAGGDKRGNGCSTNRPWWVPMQAGCLYMWEDGAFFEGVHVRLCARASARLFWWAMPSSVSAPWRWRAPFPWPIHARAVGPGWRNAGGLGQARRLARTVTLTTRCAMCREAFGCLFGTAW